MFRPLIKEYVDGAGILWHSVAGTVRSDQVARPVAGKWSILEVVCHVADIEGVFAERMKRVIAEDEPNLPNADENRWAEVLGYQQRDVNEEVAAVASLRQQMCRILLAQPAEAFSRQGVHSTAGPLSLEQLLVTVTRHLLHHVGFIKEKRRALGLK